MVLFCNPIDSVKSRHQDLTVFSRMLPPLSPPSVFLRREPGNEANTPLTLVANTSTHCWKYTLNSIAGTPQTHLQSLDHFSTLSCKEEFTRLLSKLLSYRDVSCGSESSRGKKLYNEQDGGSSPPTSLVLRPETARRKGPGFHCLRMH